LNTLNDPKLKSLKKVVVTHFSPLPYRGGQSYEGMRGSVIEHNELLRLKPFALCYGHSHQVDNTSFGKTKILNAGSDYNKPKFTMFEVN
jgi:hypothetical protein